MRNSSSPAMKKLPLPMAFFPMAAAEPVDPIWDKCLSRLTNLRKVSISPWCNEEFMGERLRGSKVIYHRKPSPNFLGVDPVLDEDAFRAHIGKALRLQEAARWKSRKGMCIPFTTTFLRPDVTSRHREEIENNWKA